MPQYLLTSEEYESLKRRADAYDAMMEKTAKPEPTKPPAEPLLVPVPVNGEGSGLDWPNWSRFAFPHRLRACQTAAEVTSVLQANAENLAELAKVSVRAHEAIGKLASSITDALIAKAG